MYNIDYKELGNRIRAERRKQDLTQETLAEIANALNLSIEYIICGEFNYQPDMLPSEILDALNRMSGNQRKVFLNMMKTLATHQDMWPV